MTIKTIANFGAHSGKLVFDQPMAESATGATIIDQNSWRKDGYVQASKSDRIYYSGLGLLTLSVIQELAWAIGPRRASKIAERLLNSATDFCQAAKKPESLKRFSGLYVTIDRPPNKHKTAPLIELSENELDRETPDLGLPFSIFLSDNPVIHLQEKTRLFVPVGRVWTKVASAAGRYIAVE